MYENSECFLIMNVPYTYFGPPLGLKGVPVVAGFELRPPLKLYLAS